MLIAAPPSAAFTSQSPASPASEISPPIEPAEITPSSLEDLDTSLLSEATTPAAAESLTAPESEVFDQAALETLPNEGTGRLLGLLLGAGGVGLFAVTGLLFYLSGSSDTPTAAVTASETPYDGNGDASQENDFQATLDGGGDVKDVEESPINAEPEAEPQPEVALEALKEIETTTQEPLTTTVEEPAIPSASDAKPSSGPALSLPEPTDEQEQPSVSNPAAEKPTGFDPLDFDPTSLDLILTKKPPQPETPEPEPPVRDRKPQLRIASATPGPAKNLDARLSQRVAQEGISIERRETTGAPDNAIPVSERLKQPIASLALADRPVLDTLRLLGKLCGVAVTIDPVTLSQAAISPEKEVSLRETNQSVGAVFTKVLKPLRLTYEATDSGMVVLRQGLDREKTASYPISDLLRSGLGDAEAVVMLVRQFTTPGTWDNTARIEAKDRVIEVEGPATAHFEVLLLLERLRKAAEIPQRTRYPKPLLRTDAPLESLSERLQSRTTFTFIADTPLEELFQHWRNELKLEVLVDWESLAEQDLRPGTKVACSARDQPWTKALTIALAGLGLTWEAANSDVVFITTQTASKQRFSTQFYRLPNRSDDGIELTEELMSHLRGAGELEIAVRYETQSQRILVGGNCYVQQQAWAWLAERASAR